MDYRCYTILTQSLELSLLYHVNTISITVTDILRYFHPLINGYTPGQALSVATGRSETQTFRSGVH